MGKPEEAQSFFRARVRQEGSHADGAAVVTRFQKCTFLSPPGVLGGSEQRQIHLDFVVALR